MTGTGTQADPYIITTIYDFCSISNGTSDANLKYYKLGNDIDFNDHNVYKMGVSATRIINAPYTVLDEDGHKIRNFVLFRYAMNQAVFVLKEWRNCITQNFMIQNLPEDYNAWLFGQRCTFTNSSINITLNNSNPMALFMSGANFNNSVLSLTGTVERTGFPGVYTENTVNFDHSWLHLDVKTKFWKKEVTLGDYNNVALRIQGNLNYSYVTGKIVETSTPSSATDPVKITFDSMYNSYCALGIEDQRDGNHAYRIEGSHSGVNFFVKDKVKTPGTIGTWYTPNTNTMKFVTEEEVKTYGYLPGIAFPVNQTDPEGA